MGRLLREASPVKPLVNGLPLKRPISNRAAVPLTEVYATPAGLGNWGQNRLSKEPLPPDNKRLFALPRDGNCIYDLKVVFADKRAKEQKRANLCRVAELPVP